MLGVIMGLWAIPRGVVGVSLPDNLGPPATAKLLTRLTPAGVVPGEFVDGGVLTRETGGTGDRTAFGFGPPNVLG